MLDQLPSSTFPLHLTACNHSSSTSSCWCCCHCTADTAAAAALLLQLVSSPGHTPSCNYLPSAALVSSSSLTSALRMRLMAALSSSFSASYSCRAIQRTLGRQQEDNYYSLCLHRAQTTHTHTPPQAVCIRPLQPQQMPAGANANICCCICTLHAG